MSTIRGQWFPATSSLHCRRPHKKTKIANWPLVTCTIIGFSGASNYAEQGKKFSEVRVRCQEPNGTCLSLRPQPQPTQSTTDLKKEKKKTIHHSSVYHNFNLTKIRTNGNEIVLHAVLHRQVEHTRIKDDQLWRYASTKQNAKEFTQHSNDLWNYDTDASIVSTDITHRRGEIPL